MRLNPIPPEKLSAEQRPLYDRIEDGIRKYFKGFISSREDGALVGIFDPLVRYPQFGGAAWDYIMALSEHSTLPRGAHEVAILVVGAHFSSRYQIYAHEHVAALACLSASKVATIDAGERPSDLTLEESVAYDVASRLVRGGQMPEAIYQVALSAFGEQGVAELVYLIGGYCFIAAILNAYDVAVPGGGETLGDVGTGAGPSLLSYRLGGWPRVGAPPNSSSALTSTAPHPAPVAPSPSDCGNGNRVRLIETARRPR